MTQARSDIERVLDVLHQKQRRNITHWEHLPAEPARCADLPHGLSDELVSALNKRGFSKLYTHQASAFEAVNSGKDVVIVTPTASGKTLCYNLPVLQGLVKDSESRALYLFPTKALSQDQMLEVHELSSLLGKDIKVYTFDGDTPAGARRTIRASGHIVITNPDMLHTGILPQHTHWIRLFENLKYVVIDEIHHYRGVFGSHLSNVIRRLKRICEYYGSNPTFICASATIANPVELTEKIIERPVTLIDNNGAPKGERHFLFYNPDVVNEELGIRRSVISESSRLAARFIASGIQTICFARSRIRVELLAAYLKRQMQKMKKSPDIVKAYRGGFLPLERRAIEAGLRNGSVLGVVSTNALELGIDIGQLDVSILAGYPGSISSTWQQGGRAGRRRGTSVVILLASSSPIDQFIVQHPEYFFGSSPESGIVNPNNLAILISHLKCAAFELPFEDKEQFGLKDISPMLEFLEEEYVLRHRGDRWYWSSEVYPAEEISLRRATMENFIILNASNKNQTLGEVDRPSAPLLIHPNAVYMHQSETFLIENLDWDNRIAYAKQSDVDYYTDAIAKMDLKVLRVEDRVAFTSPQTKPQPRTPLPDPLERPLPEPGQEYPIVSGQFEQKESIAAEEPGRKFGEVAVTILATKFKKIKFETHESVGYGEIHLPEENLQTEAYWIDLPFDLVAGLEEKDLGGALYGLASALRSVIPVYVLCDPRDMRTVPQVRSPFSGLPALFAFDNYPGGIGIASKVYDMDSIIWQAADELLTHCGCKAGCPSCIGPPLEVGDAGKRIAQSLVGKIREMCAR